MISSVSNTINRVMQFLANVVRFSEGERKRRQPRKTISLLLEELEPIEAPAVLVWAGENEAPWSVAGNWTRNGAENQVAPVAGDTLEFDGTRNNISKVDNNFLAEIAMVDVKAEFSGTIILERDLTINTFKLHGGIFQGAYPVTVDTAFEWDGGTLRGNGNPDTSSLILTSNTNGMAGQIALDGRIIKNSGQIQWAAGAGNTTMTASNGGYIINESTGTLFTSGANTANLVGQVSELKFDVPVTIYGGTITCDADMTFDGSVTVTGNVTVEGAGGIEFFNDSVNIAGIFDVKNGTVAVEFNGATVNVTGGLLFENTASHILRGYANFSGDAPQMTVGANSSLTMNCDLAVYTGSISFGSGVIAGGVTWQDGQIYVAEDASIVNTAVFSIGLVAARSLSGDGTFTNLGSMSTRPFGSDVTISLDFVNEASFVLMDATVIFSEDWTQTANGGILLFGGSLQVNGIFTNNGGFTTAVGSGSIFADSVVNAGTITFPAGVRPGVGDTLRIRRRPGQNTGGNFTQTSAGSLSMYITDVNSTDLLQCEGTATLAGTLNVGLVPDFEFGENPIWQILTATTVAQQFDYANLPDGFAPESYGENSVLVTLAL
jgi:hypothetical protein